MSKFWYVKTPTQTIFNEVVNNSPAEYSKLEESRFNVYRNDTCVGISTFGDKNLNCGTERGFSNSGVSELITLEEFRNTFCKNKSETSATVETNPKKQFGLASLPLHLWSPLASAYGALGLYNGACKYGRNNFKATPVEASIYIAAAMRHLAAWSEGEEFDPADGVPNLGGVLANIAILLEARAAGTLVDDRQMGTGYLKERETLKQIMADVTKVHEGKSPRHYTIKDNK